MAVEQQNHIACHDKNQVPLSDPLLSRLYYNNSNSEEKEKCPRPVGFFKGVKRQGNKLVKSKGNIACNSWKCPVCSKRKANIVKSRIFKGQIQTLTNKNGFRSKYFVKFLTLTFPGNEIREKVSPGEAEIQMKENFNRLITALRKKYGHFGYIWTQELKNGYPHLHVLLFGENVISWQFGHDCKYFWENYYGMGFAKIKPLDNVEHGVRYICKYMAKGEMENINKGSRVISSSRGALEPPYNKPVWEHKRFYLGVVSADDDYYDEIDLDIQQLSISEVVLNAMTQELKDRLIEEQRELFVLTEYQAMVS